IAIQTSTQVTRQQGFEKAKDALLSGKALQSFKKLQQLSQA
ncbi:MAG TPA: anthranilate phosphoribosyltransferase, partial [Salinimicrobium catena]|nr:anthranilate phosphoribosyltransferase [Salinimicrobium catena]